MNGTVSWQKDYGSCHRAGFLGAKAVLIQSHRANTTYGENDEGTRLLNSEGASRRSAEHSRSAVRQHSELAMTRWERQAVCISSSHSTSCYSQLSDAEGCPVSNALYMPDSAALPPILYVLNTPTTCYHEKPNT